jgi:hypothetical protein
MSPTISPMPVAFPTSAGDQIPQSFITQPDAAPCNHYFEQRESIQKGAASAGPRESLYPIAFAGGWRQSLRRFANDPVAKIFQCGEPLFPLHKIINLSATGCSRPARRRKSMRIGCRSSTHLVLRQCEIVVQRARPERLAKPRERERTHGELAQHQTRVRLRGEKPAEPDRCLLFA